MNDNHGLEGILSMKTQVWAHRGASAYAPENTLEAFRLAAEMYTISYMIQYYQRLRGKNLWQKLNRMDSL